MYVLVLGSINMDLVAKAPHLPAPGETVTGHEFVTMPGGKGANQAVACARLGGTAKMIGRVGADLFGAELLSSLQAHGVDVAGVTVDNGRASGIAQIAVDDTGENNIIVVPGANGLVGPAELAHLETALQQATVLLLQCEIPLDTVIASARLAQERGVLVILDPAPARPLPADLYPLIDIITPNETETALLLGFPITGEPAMQHACDQLLARGVNPHSAPKYQLNNNFE
jgi:ribokinase